MQIPYGSNHDINKLALIFKSTTASYKFFFFIALLDSFLNKIKENKKPFILLDDISIRMIVLAWYPALYFKLNFGFADKLSQICHTIQNKYKLSTDTKESDIYILLNKIVYKDTDRELKIAIKNLLKYVPSKLLTPWTPKEFQCNGVPNKDIYDNFLSNYDVNKSLYRIIQKDKKLYIDINDVYIQYLQNNFYILKSFSYYHLCIYLEKLNAGVPNISTKIKSEILRDNLNDEHRVFDEILNISPLCSIFNENIIIDKNNYALDHFIPWSFILNNIFYNLSPLDQSTNSKKSNKIPDEIYIEHLSSLHYSIVQYIAHGQIKRPKSKIIQSYEDLRKCSFNELIKLDKKSFFESMHNKIAPLIFVAKDSGFEPLTENDLSLNS